MYEKTIEMVLEQLPLSPKVATALLKYVRRGGTFVIRNLLHNGVSGRFSGSAINVRRKTKRLIWKLLSTELWCLSESGCVRSPLHLRQLRK